MGERPSGVYWITPKLHQGSTFATLANYHPGEKEPWEIGGLRYTEAQLSNLYDIGKQFDTLRTDYRPPQA